MASGPNGGAGNTRSIRARLVLADQLTRDGDLMQAASVYAQVAHSYASAGRAQESVAIAVRAQQLSPEWFTVKTIGNVLTQLQAAGVPLCTRAAEAHWRTGRVTEALQFYYQATQLDPEDAPALIRLGQAYENQTLYKEATATFVVASRRLLEQGLTPDFIAVAEQILRLDGGHAPTLRELAAAYLHVGEPRRAVAKLTALMQVVPEDPAGYEILAQAFACIGKEDVALSVLTRLADELRDEGLNEDAADLLWRASRWLPNDRAFQRRVAALANDEVPTTVTSDEADESMIRSGVTTLGPEDISQLDENSGVYRDREGTNVLSLDDIALLDDLLVTGLRGEAGAGAVTRAEILDTPKPPKRIGATKRPAVHAPSMRDRGPSRSRPRAFEDGPPTRVIDDGPPTLVKDDAQTRIPPPRDPSRQGDGRPPALRKKTARPPILTKHEGTIVLDLRDLAVVGESREESVVLDISDVEQTEYRLPDLIVDEESLEIDLEPTDMVTINKRMPAPPPLKTAIRPHRTPRAHTAPVKIAHPKLPPLSRAAGGRRPLDDEAPTLPPGVMAGKPQLSDVDLDDEQPTAMMAVNPADIMKDLFKKKRTGRDRSASLLDKLGPKPARKRTQPVAAAQPSKPATARRSRRRTATTTAPQAVVQASVLPPQDEPAVTGDAQVTKRPTQPSSKAGVRWKKPTAPKRGKPK
ncbi:MAG: hypothetical protein JKY37_21710 [Nannocystaceae bacterium]|nr:hypothetical protein [Nannocystaceae bacterium]